MSSLAVLLLLVGALWPLWRVLRAYLTKSPLDNIPGPPRTSLLKGNLPDLFDRHGWDFHDHVIEAYPAISKYYSPFGGRGLYVADPLALHHVIVKEQNVVYEEPTWFLAWVQLSFGTCLLSTAGEHHRRQRKLLNPVFSIAHMRDMTPLFYRTVHRLETAVRNQVTESPVGDVDVCKWMTRTALELIGQGGLGYSFDPLTKNVPNSYGDAIKQMAPTTYALQFWRTLYPNVRNLGSPAFRREVAKRLPHPTMQYMRQLVETSAEQSRQIYNAKKAAFEKGDEAAVHQVGEGKDIISILMKANMTAADEDKLPDDEVIAQMSMFVFAATDTTTSALSRILHLLAEHQDVQDKIRAELEEAAPGGEDIPYDQLVDLPYLDAVCRETLRLHPPVSFMSREVLQDTVLPFSEPIIGVDGRTLTETYVPKGTTIIVGIRACNRNKAMWGEDVLEWKPDRWLKPLPSSVTEARIPGIYSNLMTFLGGGRACIGFKFSQLEMKVVLAVMLRAFKFRLSDKGIYWNLSAIAYPTVGRDSTEVSLPMKLETLSVT